MLCDDYCEYCRYSGVVCDPADESLMQICEYYLQTYERRPCPAGTGCYIREKVDVPTYEHRRRDSERKRKYRRYVASVLQGAQAAVILDFMEREGYTTSTLSRKMGVDPSTVRRWITEGGFANWDDLAVIGLPKPEGMPTLKEH